MLMLASATDEKARRKRNVRFYSKKNEQRITNDDAGKFGSRSDLYGVLLVNRNKTLIGHEMRP